MTLLVGFGGQYSRMGGGVLIAVTRKNQRLLPNSLEDVDNPLPHNLVTNRVQNYLSVAAINLLRPQAHTLRLSESET